jgi:RHS repeat-associated protein
VAVAQLVRKAFPGVVDQAAPALAIPSGARVVGYSNDFAAELELSRGKHAVAISTTPIATVGSSGGAVPLNPELVDVGGMYRLASSPAEVQVSSRPGSGARLPLSGISFVPASGTGAALESDSGVPDGDSVLYANTQASTDTLIKPLSAGLEADTILRSANSPQQFWFRVSAPQDANLKLMQSASGTIDIDEDGSHVATVLPPSAEDAAGTAVPVSMSLSGNLVRVSVPHRSGSYLYPLIVDPTVVDTQFYESHWQYESKGGTLWGYDEPTGLVDTGEMSSGDYGLWGYETQGESHIYGFTSETSSSGEHVENELGIVKPEGKEASALHPGQYSTTRTELCVESGCAPGKVTSQNKGNVAYFEQVGLGSGLSSFTSTMSSTAVDILQEKGPSTYYNTTSPTFNEGFEKESTTNVLYANTWLGPHNLSAFRVEGSADPGIGINKWSVTSSPAAPSWEYKESLSCVECYEYEGNPHLSYWHGSGSLPDGEDQVEIKVSNATGESASAKAKVKVDGTPPHEITLSGLPANDEIGNGIYKLKATSRDGSGTTPSSGVKSMVLKVDGVERGSAAGSCSPGPCTATAEWEISGEEFAVGQHEVTVTATDNANNVAVEKFTMYVAQPTTPVSVGPGQVNPQTGEMHLGATDVSIGGGLANLSVGRSYGSLHLTEGSEGPLGPQWNLGLGGAAQSLVKLPDKDMLLKSGVGLQAVFASTGGTTFTSPAGDSNLTLTESTVEGKIQYALTDKGGSATIFTSYGVLEGHVWLATRRETPGGLNAITTSYQTVGSITEPTQILAPTPAGVTSCTSGLVKGCRALGFVYASKTTATGDSKSEWGEYQGRLKEITFTAWSTSAGKMTTTAVAQYEYDKEGKLRAEWDPRISPALKTTYGYDAEGHVTSISQPGMEPWLLAYGTFAGGDVRSGKLLTVTRPSAATALGGSIAPSNTAAPALSSSEPEVSKMISVSSGSWSNTPLAYSYQWEQCNSSGGSCSPILGATNQSYVPTSSQVGDTLTVEIHAVNANGTTAVSAAVSKPLSYFKPKYLSQFATPSTNKGVATDSSGNIWTIGMVSFMLEKYSPSGEKLVAVGGYGKGNGQFLVPQGVTVDGHGNVWVADSGNNRIQEFESNGKYLSQFGISGTGNGEFKSPEGIAFNSSGDIWVADTNNDRVQELEPNGKFLQQFGSEGTTEGKFKGPSSLAIDPSGNLWVADVGNSRMQEFSQSGRFLAQYSVSGLSKFTIAPSGDLWISRTPATIEVMSPSGSILESFGSEGTGNGQFEGVGPLAFASGENTLVVGEAKDRIQRFTTAEWGSTPAPPNPGTNAVTTIEYKVPVSGAGAPYNMSYEEIVKWGQRHATPKEAMAVFPPDEPQSWPAQDYKRATIYYLDSMGRTVNVAAPGGGITTAEYNEPYQGNDVLRSLSADNRATALKEGTKSEEASKKLDVESTYNSEGNELLSTLGPRHKVKLANGKEVEARAHTVYSYDEGAPTEGGPYTLVTKTTVGAQIEGEAEQDVRTSTTSYSGQENLGWKLREPTSITTDPSGLKITHTKLYDSTTGNVIETRMPKSPGAESAHDEKFVYYAAAANSSYPECGEHAELAGVLCQRRPAAQPGTAGLPELPVSSYSKYNVWDEPETVKETVGSTPRTTTVTYDGAGRELTSGTSSTVGSALPTTTSEYNSETGMISKQSTVVGGKTQAISSVANKLGQITSYMDADGNESTFEYETEKDGRLTKVNDGKGTQSYSYNETTGAVKELTDSAAGKFTASYDAEGNLTSEGYPNGMSADYTLNSIGENTGLEYIKTTHCSSGCTWYSDSIVPSIHEQALAQASTLASQAYVYDAAGRLTQVQETPTGKGCVTRIYGYDEDTNRTSMTTREPLAEGKCASEGGTVTNHSYDSADRLVDTGVAYETFGNTTALPAADAGGAELTSSFYTNNRLATQTQAGQTIGYQLDPSRRVREIVYTGKTVGTIINHYSDGSEMPAWSSEVSGKWTRYIGGIAGGLAAIQKNGEAAVLQLTDLRGDIVGTAALSETETKLLSSVRSTEYGVPTTESPPRYSWLGSGELATELSAGIMGMGVRSYVPQLGRFLQTDPVSGGSANAYAYVFGDPVNESDPTGAFADWFKEFAAKNAAEVVVAVAARELAAEEEARRKAREAEELAHLGGSEGAAEPVGGYEGWACEYAEETGQEAEGCGGGGMLSPIYDSMAGSRNGGGGVGEPGTHGGDECRSGGKKNKKGQCEVVYSKPPSWCKAVEVAYMAGGFAAAAAKAAELSPVMAIAGAIILNQCLG